MNLRTERFALWAVLLVLLAATFGPTIASRNGSGTYTIPNTFSPGDPISSSAHNQNFADIASELTNSVAADGQTTMTGPLKAAAGTEAAPTLTFGADGDTGFYRSSSNQVSATAGGTQIVKIDSNGLDVASGRVLQGGASLIPPGTFFDYGGSTAPTGYLLAYGQCESQATYPDLYAVFGSTYDDGCSGSEFGVPDLRGRVVAGKDDMGSVSANRLTDQSGGVDGDTLGDAGGAETHTLTEAQLATHDHVASSNITGDHDHGNSFPAREWSSASGTSNNFVSAGNSGGSTYQYTTDETDVNGDHNHTITVNNAGSGQAHNNVQPTFVLNKIVKY